MLEATLNRAIKACLVRINTALEIQTVFLMLPEIVTICIVLLQFATVLLGVSGADVPHAA